MPRPLQVALRWLGRMGIAFLAFLVLYFLVDALAPNSLWRFVAGLGAIVTGFWVAIRMLRMAAKQAIWRLRNRLLVTYLFIAVVPILLIVVLAAGGAEFLARQLAVYLVTSELDRRVENLQAASESVEQAAPIDRLGVVRGMVDLFYLKRYPGIEVSLHDGAHTFRYPPGASLVPPPVGWSDVSGPLVRDRKFYLWSYRKTEWGDITITVPLTREFLEGLVPNLGVVDLLESNTSRAVFGPGSSKTRRLPAAVNRFDNEFLWYATLPMGDWDKPATERRGLLVVRSRTSAVLNAVFNRKTDIVQGALQIGLIAGVVVFFIVEITSLIIGVAMTRTITSAVHRLYRGTQRMIEGDFSHRIDVTGHDQLAELSRSFNSMTENLERLLVVAKEKERLQSEIEIAREVQNQLYPRVVPTTRTLRLTAICQPARMVSGDYYDYECIRDSQLALAIGDVAGKGISAALLMATLQSSLRTQLQNWMEVAAAAGNGSSIKTVSTSHVVSRLNNQLHAYTSSEKYATFCLGVFDEPTAAFTYTNAGHLPPVLVREGVGHRLDVNGTVVGAFPFSIYGESRVEMKSGDLLVFFTDGITEPENEYGEMFGEDRLVDLIARNAHRTEPEIIDLVLSGVHQWTASEELQDDMTILMARRV
ncbi:MAG TPA: SpoIIE family protein phosphatase [Bryobacteraceae bacterium]|nr:SpoIIE family protein phosphatase [Bryobacteraceae bacterium]